MDETNKTVSEKIFPVNCTIKEKRNCVNAVGDENGMVASSVVWHWQNEPCAVYVRAGTTTAVPMRAVGEQAIERDERQPSCKVGCALCIG